MKKKKFIKLMCTWEDGKEELLEFLDKAGSGKLTK